MGCYDLQIKTSRFLLTLTVHIHVNWVVLWGKVLVIPATLALFFSDLTWQQMIAGPLLFLILDVFSCLIFQKTTCEEFSKLYVCHHGDPHHHRIDFQFNIIHLFVQQHLKNQRDIWKIPQSLLVDVRHLPALYCSFHQTVFCHYKITLFKCLHKYFMWGMREARQHFPSPSLCF